MKLKLFFYTICVLFIACSAASLSLSTEDESIKTWPIFELVVPLIKAFFKDIFNFIFDHNKDRADPDAYKSPAEVVTSSGYSFEEHKIVTEDGYILTAWRIPKKLDEFTNLKRQPVILQHGLLDNSYTWLVNNRTNNLPYLLVNEGYDVWMTNNRGNIHSKEHVDPVEYSPKSPSGKYWDFSFDEMAKYDLPANIKYIKRVTEFEKVIYIGHSQGSTQFFAKIADDPDFKEHIKIFIGIGPAVFVKNLNSTAIELLSKIHIFDILLRMKIKKLLVVPTYVNPLLRRVCHTLPNTCLVAISMLCGKDELIQIEASRMPVMAAHEPGGTSSQNIVHWMQMVRTGNFAKYDYGKKGNMEKYGTKTPPVYNTSNFASFDVPMYLFAGLTDYLVSKPDFEKLLEKLNIDDKYAKVKIIDDFAHLDYLWGYQAMKYIYLDTVAFLKEIDNIEVDNKAEIEIY